MEKPVDGSFGISQMRAFMLQSFYQMFYGEV